jgi:hypothetical protein
VEANWRAGLDQRLLKASLFADRGRAEEGSRNRELELEQEREQELEQEQEPEFVRELEQELESKLEQELEQELESKLERELESEFELEWERWMLGVREGVYERSGAAWVRQAAPSTSTCLPTPLRTRLLVLQVFDSTPSEGVPAPNGSLGGARPQR